MRWENDGLVSRAHHTERELEGGRVMKLPRGLTDNWLWLLSGVGLFGFGTYKFFELAVAPRLRRNG